MANLYDKASLVLPSSPAYKAGVIQAYKPLTDGGTFDFTRATSANRINSDNLIESVGNNVPRMDYTDGSCPSLLLEPQSTNLINYPVSFSNSYWTKSGASIEGDNSSLTSIYSSDFSSGVDGWLAFGLGTVDGNIDGIGGQNDTLRYTVSTAIGDARYFKRASSLVIGKFYKMTLEYYIPSTNVNLTNIFINNDNNNKSGNQDAWTESSAFFKATTTDAIVTVGDFDLYLNPATDGDVAYIKNVVISEAVGFASPSADEPLGALKLVEDTATTTHQIQRGFSFLNQKYSLSAFVKADERNWIKVNLYDGSSSVYSYFDLTNGVVGQELGTTGKIEDYGNGWYKCSISSTSNVSSGNGNISIRLAENNGGTGYVGDGTSGVYIYGAQLEQQPYPTSFIYNGTEGSSVTRVAETCGGAGDSTVFNSTEGVLYAEIAALADDNTNRGISITDGTSTNRITFLLSSASNTLRVFGVSGDLQFNLQSSIFNTLNYNKIAVLYQLNNFKFFINGTQIGSSTSGAVPIGLNSIVFDNGSGGLNFYGNVNQVITFNTALSDTELAALTTL